MASLLGVPTPSAGASLDLRPVDGDHHWPRSSVAPAEPHAFAAKLRLSAGNDNEELTFAMAEPKGHEH